MNDDASPLLLITYSNNKDRDPTIGLSKLMEEQPQRQQQHQNQRCNNIRTYNDDYFFRKHREKSRQGEDGGAVTTYGDDDKIGNDNKGADYLVDSFKSYLPSRRTSKAIPVFQMSNELKQRLSIVHLL
jgi:coproporphyrinogen III oxidase